MGSTAEMLIKQQQVKVLYMKGELTNKEIAIHCDVSETSISEWTAKFKWKEAREYRVKKGALLEELENLDLEYFLSIWRDFIEHRFPYMAASWEIYMQEFREFLNR
ncbi:MAG: hypothetical protein JST19_20520 [Bacteroidetes bacterium]|nr:hypothetical protein [Bacteroidota bacterium]